jgi:hypothetical protein
MKYELLPFTMPVTFALTLLASLFFILDVISVGKIQKKNTRLREMLPV